MRYPVGVEYAYRTILLELVKALKQLLKEHMSPIVPRMVKEATNKDLPTGAIRQDAWYDDLQRVLNRIANNMTRPVNKAIRDMINQGPQVNQANRNEWARLVRSQYGVDPTSDDPERWNELLNRWAGDNARLIQDIPNKTIRQIQEQTVEALQSGRAPEDMANDIFDIMSERTEVSDSRARLIARDQIAKLNADFTQQRQTDIGVEGYIWRTVGDERVRETHAAVDGRYFSWSLPPDETDGNHPGEDFQCRCWAEPVLPEVMEFQASLLEMEEA